MTSVISTPSLLYESYNKLPNRYIVLDVETRLSAEEVGGWQFAEKMGVSVAVIYDSSTDAFTHYTQKTLPTLFKILKKVNLVIGFNHTDFDYTVLQPFAPYNLQELSSLDLLKEIKKQRSHRVSLDNLAQATLNIKKTATGLEALQWWKEENIQSIIQYCQQDVTITKDLFLFGHNHQQIFFTNNENKIIAIPVRW